MADTADIDPDDIVEEGKKKGGKGGLIIGLVLMLVLGGGGFFAVYSGMLALPIGGGEEHAKEEKAAKPPPDLPPTAFVPLDEIVISLGRGARARHLVMSAELEVEPLHQAEVEMLKPRVLDVLNTYLRALDEKDVQDPAAMARLRAQMLRRIQVVTGEGRVRDLLITRFVLQ
ncbi:flagellar basal body-associated FliL family protein [Rhodovulum sp. DZ06]|uniref:flagellar basal body-associated FliL family protein n=1 Tax=Rhodovulum sp. DZ06 TaxID=3425126 RepID=UPI003D33D5A7